MKYMKKFAMLLAAFCAVLAVSCSDDETDSGVADRLFRPVTVTLVPRGTTLTASWTGIKGAVGYWVELYSRESVQNATGTSHNEYQLVASNEQLSEPKWTVSGLDYNTIYYFRVKAIHNDAAQNSYFSDFYSIRVPGKTEVLSCVVVDQVKAIVDFTWMDGYGVEFVTITAPDGGVQTVYVDDAAGGFTQSGFASGTYTATAGNSKETFNTVQFVIPVLYAMDLSKVTFDDITFQWRADADIRQLVLTNATDASDVVEIELSSEAKENGEYVYPMSDGLLKPNTTYNAVLRYADDLEEPKEDSNMVSFTTMQTKPAGVVVVSTVDEFKAAYTIDGAVVALQPGEYIFEENVVITGAVTIMAATKQMPKLIVNQFTVSPTKYLDGTIRFENLECECKNLNNTTSCFIDHTGQAANIKRIEVEGCYIHDYGSSFMRFNRVDFTVEEVYVNDCRLLRMYGQNSYMNLTKGVNEVTYTNNTTTGLNTQNTGVRFLTYNANDATRVVVNNNTFADYHNKGRLFFHINGLISGSDTAGSVEIRNNIFCTEEEVLCNVDNFASRTVMTNIENNVVTKGWGNGNDSGTDPTEKLASWGNKYVEFDPQFKNYAGCDFTVGNDEVRKLGVGDPRWLK
ncbi:MAG: DUF5123 domain-containing protein [Alistipes senegalensis]|nr:DUF5123 domain-containing protein [Bacteroides cellulosilyticus]MCM1352560.1 DUF5123 domain-containing protein [Alistipes senegalensis]